MLFGKRHLEMLSVCNWVDKDGPDPGKMWGVGIVGETLGLRLTQRLPAALPEPVLMASLA